MGNLGALGERDEKEKDRRTFTWSNNDSLSFFCVCVCVCVCVCECVRARVCVRASSLAFQETIQLANDINKQGPEDRMEAWMTA